MVNAKLKLVLFIINEYNEDEYAKSNFDSLVNADLNQTVDQFSFTFKDLKILPFMISKELINHFMESN